MTESLETYLDSYKDKTLPRSFLNNYSIYGYDTQNDFELVLNFLLYNIYNISIVEDSNVRIHQTDFSNKIRKKFKSCIILGSIDEECEAAHIVEIKNGGDYNINNGLLLNSGIHKTFDKYRWTINPLTLIIEVKPNHNGTIKKYEGIKVNIEINNMLFYYLKQRYDIFIGKID